MKHRFLSEYEVKYIYLKKVYPSIFLKKKTPKDSFTQKNIKASDSFKICMHFFTITIIIFPLKFTSNR